MFVFPISLSFFTGDKIMVNKFRIYSPSFTLLVLHLISIAENF